MKIKEERKYWKLTFPSYLFPLLTGNLECQGVVTDSHGGPPDRSLPGGFSGARKHRGTSSSLGRALV